MKKNQKKLSLNRETLQSLSSQGLKDAVGGTVSQLTDGCTMPSWGCSNNSCDICYEQ